MQFAHTHKDEESLPGTLAIEGLTKDHLHQMFLGHANQLMMMIGLSIASPHDQFNKSFGREIAQSRLVPIVTNLVDIVPNGTKHIYQFNTNLKLGKKSHFVSFLVTTVAESKLVKLIEAYIEPGEYT